VTVTDPAGKWKKFTTDTFGNLVQVDEPNPGTSPPAAITIYNTGVTSSGLAADGSTDAHYTLISSADPSYPGPAALVVNSNSWPLPSPWLADGPNSKWIGPRADAGNSNSAGNYTYRTTFDLTGMDPTTANLTGSVAADDSVTVKLNGAVVASAGGFSSFTYFSITAGFVAGVNTLDFVVNNGGTSASPTGLRVEIGGTAAPQGSSGSDLITTYGYDILGNVTSVSMTRGSNTQTRSFTYSGNYLLSATNPENGTVTYTYNGYNKVATRTDAKGQKVVYTYDAYARLTKVQRYPTANGSEDTCQQENYYYDSNPFDGTYSQNVLGRLAAVQYYGGNTSSYDQYNLCDTTFTEMYSYSTAGGVTGKRLRVQRSYVNYYSNVVNGTLDLDAAFTYDNEGRMLTEQYPSSGPPGSTVAGPNLSFAYDAMGRPNTLTDATANQQIIQSASYNAAGEVTQISGGYYSGAWSGETRAYNSLLQLTQVYSGSVWKTYIYPASGNNGKIVADVDGVRGEQVSYTYDALNRLASAVSNSSSAPWGQGFGYDGFGNLTNVNVIKGSAPTLSVYYDPTTNHGSCADANGNTNSSSACREYGTYAYDIENRLHNTVSYSSPVFYSYAPGNKRVWKGTGTDNTNASSPQLTDEVTFWSPSGQKLATYQMTEDFYGYSVYCNQTGSYYYFGGKMIKNAAGWVYTDRLGSIGKYYPYGQERPSATQNGTEKFTGYFRDAETGLDYADQRYEQPGLGRFLTADRMRGDPRVPGSFNKYSYTGGDPVNRGDPSGSEWVCWGWSDDLNCSLEPDPDPLTLEELCLMNVGGCQGEQVGQPTGGNPPGPPASLSSIVQSSLQAGAKAFAYMLRGDYESTNCVQDMLKLRITPDQWASALENADIEDGTTSTVPLWTTMSQDDAGYQWAVNHPNFTVSDQFKNPGLNAWSSAVGNQIWFNPQNINPGDVYAVDSLIAHEALHNLGLLDPTIQSKLGLVVGPDTTNISRQIAIDCLGSGPTGTLLP